MKEFVKNCTESLAFVSAHGCITSSVFTVPRNKIIVVFGRPGEYLDNSVINAILCQKKTCLDVLAGKSSATLNGVPIYTVVAKAGDVISDVVLKFKDERFETGVFQFPISSPKRLMDVPVEMIRLSKLFSLINRPGAYFIAACRSNCYHQAAVLQRAQALDEVIRRQSPLVYMPPTEFSQNLTFWATYVEYQKSVNLPATVGHLYIDFAQTRLPGNTDYNSAVHDYQQGALKCGRLLEHFSVYELAELFLLRDRLIKIWTIYQLIASVQRKHGLQWSYGLVASSQLFQHVSSSNELTNIVARFNTNQNKGTVLNLQRRDRTTANEANSEDANLAQSLAESCAEEDKHITYVAAHKFLQNILTGQAWKPLFRRDGAVNDTIQAQVLRKRRWWKLW